LQGYLGELLIKHGQLINNVLEQLRVCYEPLRISCSHLRGKELRFILFNDSSFANRPGKYAQACSVLAIAIDDGKLRGTRAVILCTKSNKSKRVATSTLHAETLAAMQGCEIAEQYQEIFIELFNAGYTAKKLINTTPESFIPIDVFTDCEDLEACILAPVQRVSNKALNVYIAALRGDFSSGRLRNMGWVDTDDMVANCGTKLDEKAAKPLLVGNLHQLMKENLVVLAKPYRLHGQVCNH
jgi:hypothetical protein